MPPGGGRVKNRSWEDAIGTVFQLKPSLTLSGAEETEKNPYKKKKRKME